MKTCIQVKDSSGVDSAVAIMYTQIALRNGVKQRSVKDNVCIWFFFF